MPSKHTCNIDSTEVSGGKLCTLISFYVKGLWDELVVFKLKVCVTG